jgi:C1A family cysteine protease
MSNTTNYFFKSGFIPDKEDTRDFLYSSTPSIQKASIPPIVDHSGEMSPIKYQGSFGSCVAFAVCALKEWQEKTEDESEIKAGKDYKRKSVDYNFSEQWVYWNCKKIDPWPNSEGTNIRSAMKVLQRIGVPIEEAWPYKEGSVDIGKPHQWANLIARWSIIGSYWRITTLDELKRALVESPVVIGMEIFEEFYEMPNSLGYVPMPKNRDKSYGGHAVCAVGYDENKKCIKIKNSWSIFWGDRGYAWLPYDYVNEFVDDMWVAQDISVTRDMLKGARNLLE